MGSDSTINMSKLYHIGCRRGEVGRYVLLPGDPGRVPMIASLLDDAKEISHNREYLTYTGTLLGEKVSVTSTGMGCPSTAIAVEELAIAGADTFIRVGTSGPMQDFIEAGDLLIAWGAIRDEYTSKQYVPPEYPAPSAYHNKLTGVCQTSLPHQQHIYRSTLQIRITTRHPTHPIIHLYS